MHWKVKQMILVAIYRESIAQLVSSVCKLSAPAMHLLLKTSQRYLQMEKSLIFFKQVQQKLKHGNKNLGFQLKWHWNLWGVLFWISSSNKQKWNCQQADRFTFKMSILFQSNNFNLMGLWYDFWIQIAATLRYPRI